MKVKLEQVLIERAHLIISSTENLTAWGNRKRKLDEIISIKNREERIKKLKVFTRGGLKLITNICPNNNIAIANYDY